MLKLENFKLKLFYREEKLTRYPFITKDEIKVMDPFELTINNELVTKASSRYIDCVIDSKTKKEIKKWIKRK